MKKKFIKQRNKVTTLIKKTKIEYYEKEFKKRMKSPKLMWRLINDLATNKTRTISPPTKLIQGTTTLNNEAEICEAFNIFFATIGTNLADMLPSCTPPIDYSNSLNKKQLYEFEPCTESEVSKIIDNLKSNVSIGLDRISAKSLKCIKDLIIGSLVNCINCSLKSGIFPQSLKLAKVSPIYKSGSKSDPGNYRSISILSINSKIFEAVVHTRLNKYLLSIQYISPNQYGFRPKSNTLTATIDLVTKIKSHIDKRQIALGVFIDVKKAFDTVSHHILLQKLNNIGLTGTALNFIKSYLSNRHQITQIGQSKSSLHEITTGVPQGSILGPLLFLVYINDLTQLKLNGNVTLYADDTCLFYYGTEIKSITKQAQNDLHLLSNWFKSNLLSINASKTNYIIITNRNKHITPYDPLTINGVKINKSNQEKYLGLILDEKLTWRPHIENIKSKIIPLTGALRRISSYLPKQIKYHLYNSLVKPHLDYLVPVWGSSADSNIKQLQISQNKLIKALFQFGFWTSSSIIYNETKIMNIRQLYKYNTCILIKKILQKQTHTNITFTYNHQIRHYNLRRASHISTIHINPRTTHGRTSITYEGAQIYNNLPKDIRSIQSPLLYKKCLRNFIYNNTFL